MRRAVKIGKIALVTLLLLFAGAWAVTTTTQGKRLTTPVVTAIKPPDTLGADDPLRVMTINLAHGRADGFHQALRRTRTIKKNLDAVAFVIRRERPDVVALQEADGPCVWSGRFDHVAYVAEKAELASHMRGEHVRGLQLSYGTGLIGRIPFSDALSRTFAPSPPTFSKGFVVATVEHPKAPDGIDVVSVHLDFARASVRDRQIGTLISTLKARGRPVVVMGDLNTEYSAEGPIGRLATALNLDVHAPEGGEKTFRFTDKRLDWVLVPKGWRFLEHRVLPDVVSDHQPVFVSIGVGAE